MSGSGASAPIGIGFDVGGTKVLACATTRDGDELAQQSAASPEHPDLLLPVLSQLLELLVVDELGDHAVTVEGIGVALPGLVDQNGVLHAAPNLGAANARFDSPTMLGKPLEQIATAREIKLARPVVFENDATCAAVTEVLVGAARGVNNAVVISFGTGIGAGIIADGQILHGYRRFAGEIGHMITDPRGPLCACGRTGCWETLASGNALGRLAQRLAEDPSAHVDALDLVERARHGDQRALELIGEFAHEVAIGLTNVVELLDTERLVIAGGLANSADVLLGPIRAEFAKLSRPSQRLPDDHLVAATLDSRAASIGAAMLGLGVL